MADNSGRDLPPFIYLRAGTAADSSLFLVESRLFTMPGSLPSSSWFVRTFGGSMKRPDPIGEHDGLPVFGLPLPAAVFAAMLNGMRCQELMAELIDHIPPKVKEAGISLRLWQWYLADMGLVSIDTIEEEIQARHENDQETKRIKLEEQKEKERTRLEALVGYKIMPRLAQALAARIKAEHPKYNNFNAGLVNSLTCSFVNTFTREDGVGSFKDEIVIPGAPLVDPINIAFAFGFQFKHEVTEYFQHLLAAEFLPQKIKIIGHLRCKRKSKAKPRAVEHWPSAARGLLITPFHHDLYEIVLYY